MTAQLAPNPIFRSWDNNGNPLFQGQLFTYAAGTTTPQATYTDSTQTTQNTNPIILNARGEANVWLNPTLSYKFVLQDSSGNQIWIEDNIQGVLVPSNNIIPSADNQFSLGNASFRFANGYFGTQLYVGANNTPILNGGIVGYWPQTAAEIAAGVTPTNYAYAPGDLRRYGLPIDGSDDGNNSTRIQNAISAAVASGGVGYIYHPGGTISHALQISVPNGLTVLGWNRAYCIFKFTGSPVGSPAYTRSAWRYVNGPNGSGYANVAFRHVQIWYQNAVNFAAAIELNAGGWSYFEIDDCWIKGACSYGIILDAVEICSVRNCLIENTNATVNYNLWIVNGSDRSSGQSTGFSNVITIRENQISGGTGAVGLADDGGNAHTVVSNNFNQHRFPATYAGVTGLKTHGNSYETTLQTGSANVFFTAVTQAGNPVGPCSGVSMEADGFYGNISSGALLAFQGTLYTITGITQAASAVITVNAGGSVNPFLVNAPVFIIGVSGMMQINGTVSTVTAVGGSTGAWTATLNRNSSGFSAYTSGGQAQMMHSGVSVKACNFGSQLGRGAAIDTSFLANSVCEANNDAGTASMFHYTGVHNDNCGNRLMPPQNGALPALNISGPTYGDARYQELHSGGIQLTAAFSPAQPNGTSQTGSMYQGIGVPSNTNGNNGDVYFRTDTPGTANQRLYIKIAGTWTGVL